MGAARAMGLPPPTVSHMLRRLEAEGFLRRSLDPKDLRRYRLELTPKGEAALREAERLLEGALARRLVRLSEEEQALLARLLSSLEGEA
jgi:DNA-binding MarR family transcriptional regulator